MRNQNLASDGGHARRFNCIGNTVLTVKVFYRQKWDMRTFMRMCFNDSLYNLLNNTTLCANWSLPWGVLRS